MPEADQGQRRAGSKGSAARRRPRAGGTAEAEGTLPLWVPVFLYAAVTLILFRGFVLSGEMLFGSDTLALGYMARAFFADVLRELGTFPLWNPMLFGGTPFLESLAGGDSLYPLSVLLLLLMDTHRALGWKLVVHIFLAGLFMFGWIRALGLSRAAAFLGGLTFLTAPYMVTLVFPGHDGKIFVTALTPLLFWATEVAIGRRSLLAFVGMSLTIALVIYTTHFQMAYFLFGAVGAYAIFRTVQIARTVEGGGRPLALRRFALFLGFSLLGAGAAAVQLIPAFDYVTEHSRRAMPVEEVTGEAAVEWSSSWSLHPEEIVSLAVPEFVGNNAGGAAWASETYWGRNVFKLNHEYLGLVALLLAGVAFIGGPLRGLRWFFAGLGTLVVLFTLGTHTPVWRLFFEAVPGIRLFRAPSMAIFLTGFAVATLMAVGVDHARAAMVSRDRRAADRVQLYFGAAVASLAFLFLLSVTGILPDLWSRFIRGPMEAHEQEAFEAARPFITRGFLLASLFAAGVGSVWWALRRELLPPALALGLVAVLIALDQGRVNEPFIQIQEYAAFAAPDANIQFLEERWEEEGPFRVFSMVQGGEDVRPAMFGIELAAGHHPNDLGRYRELIGMEGGGMPEHLAQFNPNVLRILNVRYVLWPELQFGPLQGAESVSRVTLPDGRVHTAVYEYSPLPRAWLVGRAVVLSDDSEALEYILGPRFEPEGEVVLEEAAPVELSGDPDGDVRWRERSSNHMSLQVRSDRPGLLVLSENWFPAWQATVDGESAPVLRANHTLRAIPVPEGDVEVELRYVSPLLRGSLGLTAISLLLLGGIGIAARRAARRGGAPPREG